ncbi:hypothetical protein CDSM653_01772 [Caldanaerobacter subterraneus subsp. pacificus DSM 12653]|uniref:Uncharacterized protein n=1 Tax=Caldanaerobacter subterraneus subsp. pacificus DSM 12653 TaxID=391606 RepID=A0A0F5PL87_9THEO|nr:hypothetical protein CDSM653_01772 [Caldanaerobacter subterraneus subsp. pacificus DSM 12653]
MSSVLMDLILVFSPKKYYNNIENWKREYLR